MPTTRQLTHPVLMVSAFAVLAATAACGAPTTDGPPAQTPATVTPPTATTEPTPAVPETPTKEATPPTPPAGPVAPEPTAPTTATDAPGGAVGATCGTRGAGPCGTGLYCGFEAGANCGRADAPGKCKAPTAICTKEYKPVCGCDGKTYSNACSAGNASTGIDHTGACKKK